MFFAEGSQSPLLVTLGIFAAAFLARPIGALFFGQLGDRVGRKRALMLSALLMAVAKLIEGLLPTYAMIGFLAPAVFVLARVISGISLGGEFTGTFVMLFELARAGRRGRTTSFANVMAGLGVFLASGLVALLTAVPLQGVHANLGLANSFLCRFTHRVRGAGDSHTGAGDPPL